jgi:7,8-dihydropterin-6-yl-methyl-4-(beta-D-ribofuranosyl)aminobenzene 5'-phosphate synthase
VINLSLNRKSIFGLIQSSFSGKVDWATIGGLKVKKITCVVDNTVQQGSPFWGEHGLSFRLQIDESCALFDTGHSESVLLHNLGLLGRCPRDASAVILSHAHLDHTGGLAAVLSQKPGLPLYANPDFFRPRFTFRSGEYKSIGLSLSQEELTRLADLHLNAEPVEILPGVWTTGEIVDRTEPEGRSSRHFVPDGENWQPDPYKDDMALVLETGEGLVVICGCCHAGLLNTLSHVKKTFQRPISAVLGGTHLLNASQEHLQRVVKILRDGYNSPHLYLNHCTGVQAYLTLANAFGDRVNPCPVGTTLTFD